jgi:hypothetical protein
MTKRRQTHGYGVMTVKGSILSPNGEYYKPLFIGPGAHSAKTWKTRAGAERVAKRIHGSVFVI